MKDLSLETIKSYDDTFWLWYLAKNTIFDTDNIKEQKKWLIKKVEEQNTLLQDNKIKIEDYEDALQKIHTTLEKYQDALQKIRIALENSSKLNENCLIGEILKDFNI